MILFSVVVAVEFWDTPRTWPDGCAPVVFSTDLVMRNAGTVQVPPQCGPAVERMLRAHPHVISVARVAMGDGRWKRRKAA